MERNFETVMIEQCAPVLASLKPAGLFRYETRDCADLARRVKNWNTQLNPKGLRVRVLKGCVLNHRYLVYVYRESKLAAVLADEKVQSFLRQEGYRLPEAGEAPDVGNMLTQLSRKLCCSAEFPHEIGVFLGYPLGDVVGFIENRGKNFTCCGCWKSYGDPDAAQKHFDQLSSLSAAVPQRNTHSPPCRGGLKFVILFSNTLFLSWHLLVSTHWQERNPPFDTRPRGAD